MTLAAQHTAYIARLKARGAMLAIYKTPCCVKETETLASPSGEVWDTCSTCIFCDALYMKITQGANVTTHMLTALA